METSLTARLEGAEHELAAIATAQDAELLVRKAAAAAEFAKRAKLGVSAVNHATLIRVLAERRMAQCVSAGQAAGEIAAKGQHASSSDSEDEGPVSLKDLGIDNPGRLNEARRLERDYTEDDLRELYQDATSRDEHLSRDRLLRSNAQRMQSSESNEWYTPLIYLQAARNVLGAIDLDPASSVEANKNVQASQFYSRTNSGLAQEWKGRVWMNPPYGGLTGQFVGQLVSSYRMGHVTAAICLVSSHAVDTQWFRPLWDSLLCFSYGRIPFISSDGDQDAPTHGSVFAYLGKDRAAFADEFAKYGAVVARWSDA